LAGKQIRKARSREFDSTRPDPISTRLSNVISALAERKEAERCRDQNVEQSLERGFQHPQEYSQ
jgi:hypothetical protein